LIASLDAAQALSPEPATRNIGVLQSAESNVFVAHGYFALTGHARTQRHEEQLAVMLGDDKKPCWSCCIKLTSC
jgi:hypothetical protein